MKYCVYLHHPYGRPWPFYVGKGSRGRHLSKRGRNVVWWRFVKKYGLGGVEIVHETNHEACAFTVERIEISKWKEIGFAEANIALGGQGPSVRKMSDDQKKHLSKVRKGMSYGPLSEEHKNKISESLRGKKPSNISRNKMSESQRARFSKTRHPSIKDKEYIWMHPQEGHVRANMFFMCKNYGLHQSAVSRVARGIRRSVSGWRVVED